MKDLISIIVPIYNVEKYLSKCIDSIINQTYQNIEIILVDDGSPDNCSQICDDYAERDKRIVVVHKKNGGLSDARNYGLDVCKGEYITFIDSDDYVESNYIEVLYRLLKDTNSDISIVGTNSVYEDKAVNFECCDYSNIKKVIYEKEAVIIGTLNVNISQNAWGKLYKRYLFDEIRFPVGFLYEDLAIVFNILDITTRVVVSDARLYNYLVRNNSIMHSKFSMKQYCEVEIIDNSMDFMMENYPNLELLIRARRVYSYLIVLERILLSEDRDLYVEQIDELDNKIHQYSKGLLISNSIKPSLRIKLLSYKISKSFFTLVIRFVRR